MVGFVTPVPAHLATPLGGQAEALFPQLLARPLPFLCCCGNLDDGQSVIVAGKIADLPLDNQFRTTSHLNGLSNFRRFLVGMSLMMDSMVLDLASAPSEKSKQPQTSGPVGLGLPRPSS